MLAAKKRIGFAHHDGKLMTLAVTFRVTPSQNPGQSTPVIATGNNDFTQEQGLGFALSGSPKANSVRFVSCAELPAGNLQRRGNQVQYLG
jgi:hypothetical protein